MVRVIFTLRYADSGGDFRVEALANFGFKPSSLLTSARQTSFDANHIAGFGRVSSKSFVARCCAKSISR